MSPTSIINPANIVKPINPLYLAIQEARRVEYEFTVSIDGEEVFTMPKQFEPFDGKEFTMDFGNFKIGYNGTEYTTNHQEVETTYDDFVEAFARARFLLAIKIAFRGVELQETKSGHTIWVGEGILRKCIGRLYLKNNNLCIELLNRQPKVFKKFFNLGEFYVGDYIYSESNLNKSVKRIKLDLDFRFSYHLELKDEKNFTDKTILTYKVKGSDKLLFVCVYHYLAKFYFGDSLDVFSEWLPYNELESKLLAL